MPFVDLESCLAVKDLWKDSHDGTIELDPRKYFHRFALNTSLTLNYGIRIDGGIDQEMLREGKLEPLPVFLCDTDKSLQLSTSSV
jgi:phenylacetate 2-hydroxylase